MFKLLKPHPLLVLISLLVVQLAVLSLQVKDSEGTTLLKKTTLQAISPFLLGAGLVEKILNTVWAEYINLREVRNENEALKDRIQQLILECNRNNALIRQAKQWQSLLELRGQLAFQTKPATIIGRSPSFLSFTIMIDRGTDDGIHKDDPVINADGVVGRVISVFPGTAEVHVLLDSDAAAGSLLSRTQLQGVTNGTGSAFLRLNYVLNQEDVQVGDKVVTSGLDSIYPKDLTIGRVVRTRQGESVFKEIDVLPAVDFNRMEAVLVLVNVRPRI